MVDFEKIKAEDKKFEEITKILPEFDIVQLCRRIDNKETNWDDDFLLKRIIIAVFEAGQRSK